MFQDEQTAAVGDDDSVSLQDAPSAPEVKRIDEIMTQTSQSRWSCRLCFGNVPLMGKGRGGEGGRRGEFEHVIGVMLCCRVF